MIIPNNIFVIKKDNLFIFQGPLGIQKVYLENTTITNENLIITNNSSTKKLIKKIFQGLTLGFKLKFKIVGVGYKIVKNETLGQLEVYLGFKSPVIFPLEEGIEIFISNNGTIFEGLSSSYDHLTLFFSSILQIKPAYKDKYKGKGIIRL